MTTHLLVALPDSARARLRDSVAASASILAAELPRLARLKPAVRFRRLEHRLLATLAAALEVSTDHPPFPEFRSDR